MNIGGDLRFGPGYITLEQIYLLELRQVTHASFQPILAILRPLPAPLSFDSFLGMSALSF